MKLVVLLIAFQFIAAGCYLPGPFVPSSSDTDVIITTTFQHSLKQGAPNGIVVVPFRWPAAARQMPIFVYGIPDEWLISGDRYFCEIAIEAGESRVLECIPLVTDGSVAHDSLFVQNIDSSELNQGVNKFTVFYLDTSTVARDINLITRVVIDQNGHEVRSIYWTATTELY